MLDRSSSEPARRRRPSSRRPSASLQRVRAVRNSSAGAGMGALAAGGGMAVAGAPWQAMLTAIVVTAVCGVVSTLAQLESGDKVEVVRAVLAHLEWRLQHKTPKFPGPQDAKDDGPSSRG